MGSEIKDKKGAAKILGGDLGVNTIQYTDDIELYTWNLCDFINQCHSNKFNLKTLGRGGFLIVVILGRTCLPPKVTFKWVLKHIPVWGINSK